MMLTPCVDSLPHQREKQQTASGKPTIEIEISHLQGDELLYILQTTRLQDNELPYFMVSLQQQIIYLII